MLKVTLLGHMLTSLSLQKAALILVLRITLSDMPLATHDSYILSQLRSYSGTHLVMPHSTYTIDTIYANKISAAAFHLSQYHYLNPLMTESNTSRALDGLGVFGILERALAFNPSSFIAAAF